MNRELKVMIYRAFGVLVILLIIANIVSQCRYHYNSVGTYWSQTVAINRLRHPHLNRSSSIGKYPQLKKHKKIRLVAISRVNLLYVLDGRRVIYVAHAKVNHQPTTATVNAARGERTFHVNGRLQSNAINWTSFDRLGYIESPVSLNNQRVHGNWINDRLQWIILIYPHRANTNRRYNRDHVND